jgi:hypothetical protein
MRWLPRNWNDALSLALIVGLPLYWWLAHPIDIVVGTTLGGWTLVCQYYFRKTPPEAGQ